MADFGEGTGHRDPAWHRLKARTSPPTIGDPLPPPPADPRPILVVPAAGAGSRLQGNAPKFALPVNGRAMIDWLMDLYRPHVSRVVLVVSRAGLDEVRRRASTIDVPIETVVQEEPTGMLDAMLLASDGVARSAAKRVWISWCDQVAIHPDTVGRLAMVSEARPDAAIVMPVVHRTAPYIHFHRDEHARIVRVLHRREGDELPEVGESDAGLFSLSREAFLDDLPAYARSVDLGTTTGERNFLPFIPWIAPRREVLTFPCVDEMESVGVNTPDDRAAVEAYLIARATR